MVPVRLIPVACALLLLVSPAASQDSRPATRTSVAGTVLVLVGDDAALGVKAATTRGVTRGLKAGGATALTVLADAPKSLKKSGVAADVVAIVLMTGDAETVRTVRDLEKRGVPIIDLAHHVFREKLPVLSQYHDPADEASCAAWWVCAPFQNHAVAVLAPTSGPLAEHAQLFSKVVATMADKRVAFSGATVDEPKAAAQLLAKAIAAGSTAAMVYASPETARVLANAARAVVPPFPMFVCSAGAGFEAGDRKDASKPGPMPEGTAFFCRDLPGPSALREFKSEVGVFCQDKDSTLQELDAWDAGFAVARACCAGATDGTGVLAKLATGEVAGLRGSFGERPTGDSAHSNRLRFVPWFVDGPRLRPFPPMDPEKPQPRPSRTPFPTTGWNTFTQWNTQPFRPDPGATIVEFDWTDGKVRTIEDQLLMLNMSSGGHQPVLDHLIREKLMGRLLSLTSVKFRRNTDGTAIPGKSFNICFVHKAPRTGKPKMVWKAYVAGDHPDAGGQAFGTYCFIYSKFIWRTIYKERALDEPLAFDDLDLLTTPLPAGEPYLGGTRRDVIYRIIDNYGGSMGLTASHEIGHLAGLGHDEKDPASLMNVKEGAGIHHDLGFFIPEHCLLMEKTLGLVPVKSTKPTTGT